MRSPAPERKRHQEKCCRADDGKRFARQFHNEAPDPDRDEHLHAHGRGEPADNRRKFAAKGQNAGDVKCLITEQLRAQHGTITSAKKREVHFGTSLF